MNLIVNFIVSIIMGIVSNYFYDMVKPKLPVLKKSIIKKSFIIGIVLVTFSGLFIAFNNVAKSLHINTFHDNFEEGLLDWNRHDYSDRYNQRMRWHLSSKESLSGDNSLSLGHTDTDFKDNNDDVQITTKTSFVLTEKSILKFSLKKSREINLQVLLLNSEEQLTTTIIHFSGGDTFSEWKVVSVDLSEYAGNTPYQLILQAWGQGSLYVDDIQLTNISN